jgi:hypothetical protein
VNELAGGAKGSADLCAYFFLRASTLLRDAAGFGFLATNTIAQGDTREVGLDRIVERGCTIIRAIPTRRWPGEASLEVAVVWIRRGQWAGSSMLDEQPVEGITPYLTRLTGIGGKPNRLIVNLGKAFQGSNVLGMGFVLEPAEAERLIEADARNKDVLFPYINGEDLNSHPSQMPSRWIINFFDWPLNQRTAPPNHEGHVAADFPACLKIVEAHVKPERDRLGLKPDSSSKGYAKWWWQYARKGLDLYATIAGMKRVLIIAQVSRTVAFTFVPNGWVYSHKTIVFAFHESKYFAILQSNLHGEWAWNFTSTLKRDLSYSPTDCFSTFPFPSVNDSSREQELELCGGNYHEFRRRVMATRQEGLTQTYNRFHDSDETDTDIHRLRDLHVEMDQAVAAAYGWTDLDLGHGFHETKQGIRFTISDAARREVLGRLLKLNHERYADEVAKGLHDKKKVRGKKARPGDGGGLFREGNS